MSVSKGVSAWPYLAGVRLENVSPQDVIYARNRQAELVTRAKGSVLYHGAEWGDGYPDVKIAPTFTINYEHLRHLSTTIERILSRPGPYEFVFWRQIFVSWTSDGARTEFNLPWPHAPWSMGFPPEDSLGNRSEVVVSTSQTVDSNLTYEGKTATEYDAGNPSVGEVWFDEESTGPVRLKIESALDQGAVLYVGWIPLFEVYAENPAPQPLRTLREPMALVLRERGDR